MKLLWCNYAADKGKKYILLLKLFEDNTNILGLSHNELSPSDINVIRRNIPTLMALDNNTIILWIKKQCPGAIKAIRLLPKSKMLSIKEYEAKPLGE